VNDPVNGMSAIAIEDILQQIRQLPVEDRLLLEERLAQMANEEWRSEAQAARERARQLGIDQSAIDRAIEEVRQGR
jgi:hypothetical protein